MMPDEIKPDLAKVTTERDEARREIERQAKAIAELETLRDKAAKFEAALNEIARLGYTQSGFIARTALGWRVNR